MKQALTARIKALLTKSETLRQIEEQEQVSTIEGLTQPELFVLAEIAGSIFMPHSGVLVFSVKNEVERVFTGFGFALGLRRLTSRGFVEIRGDSNYNGDSYDAVFLTEKAWNWIEGHEELFVIRRPQKESKPATITTLNTSDDDVPF
ncbi:MAG: hypothetical protein M3Y72_24435 [Acidobacteriota bacterium]|nr:hypothetical protein [Acidobacteriota bacterium]